MSEIILAAGAMFTIYAASSISLIQHFRRPRVPISILELGKPVFERGLGRWVGLAYLVFMAFGTQVMVVVLLLRVARTTPEAVVGITEIILALILAVVLWRTALPLDR